MANHLTLRDLLKDETYKKFFMTIPVLPAHYTPESLPWKLMVLKHGETQWRVKRFGTYQEAYAGLKKMLPLCEDGVINCPGLDFQPPQKVFKVKGKFHTTGRLAGKPVLTTRPWRPQLDGDMPAHNWCPYCRRPTVWGYYTTHPQMTRQRMGNFRLPLDSTLLRCGICGASERVVNLRQPMSAQGWDLTRKAS